MATSNVVFITGATSGFGEAAAQVFAALQAAYTQALLASIPEHSKGAERLATLPGVVPGQYDRPLGCLLSPRCPYVQDNCRQQRPSLDRQAHSLVRCFYPLNQEVA